MFYDASSKDRRAGAQLSTCGIRIPQLGDAYGCQPAAVRLAHLVVDSVALHQRA